jgi:hypothetical protein
MAAANNNNNNNKDDNNRNNNTQVRYRCRGCGRMLRGADERPCSNCRSDQREILPPPVNEPVAIRERRTAILRRVEKNFYYLDATLAVIIVVPLLFFFIGNADPISTIISVGAGFLGLYLGYKALTKVKKVCESVGG